MAINTDTNATEKTKSGISSIKRGSLFGIIGIIISMPIYFIDFLFISDITGMFKLYAGLSSTSGIPPNSSIIYAIFIIFGFLSFIFYIISILNYRKGFGYYMVEDKRFSGPYSFSKYIVIFFFIMIAVFALLLLINFGAARIGTIPFSGSGALIAMLAILVIVLIFSILALIGIIYLIIGLFDFSEKYNQGIGKVGAILYIIPFAALLAPIFIYIAASHAEKENNTA